MIKRIKSISKRTLSLLLTFLMILSSGIVGAVAANVDIVATGAAQPEKLYLVPNANWKIDNARFAAYFFGNGETWVSMTKVSGTEIYEVTVPTNKTYPNVIFCRMNPSASANNWNNEWNQTSDLTIPTNGTNKYTVTEGTWDKGGGTWGTYNPPHTVSIKNTWSGTNEIPALYINGSVSTENVTNGTAKTYSVTGGSTFSFTCSSPTFYYVSSLKIDGTEYVNEKTYLPKCWYKVEYSEAINKDVSIEIVHSPNPNVVLGGVENGSLALYKNSASVSGSKYTYKDSITCTANANDGYYVSKVWAENASGTKVVEETNTNINTDTLSATIEQVTENVTFYAEFKPKTTYTVTFVDWDGRVISTQTIVEGKSATAPDNPSRTGYTFKGWDTDFTNVQSNLTVTAQYTNIDYIVKFEDHDGTQIGETQTLHYNDMPKIPDDPTRKGYTFAGWNPIVEAVTKEVTYKATYTPIPYTVTTSSNPEDKVQVSVNGANAEGKADYDSTITFSYTNLDSEYKFVKWIITNNGDITEYTTDTASVKVQGIVSAVAVLEKKEFRTITITLEGNGTVTTDDGVIDAEGKLIVERGSDVTLTFNAAPDHYISNLNGTSGNQGKTTGKVEITDIDVDTIVSVKFEPKTPFDITVTNSNQTAGTYTIDKTNGLYGDKYTIQATPIQNSGYVFKSFTVNGSSVTDNPYTGTITKDTTILVNWEEQSWKNIILVEDVQTIPWSKHYAWVFSGSKDYNEGTSWPGREMELVGKSATGKNIYAIRVSATAGEIANGDVKVIFNGGSNTTKANELILKSDKNYYIINSKSNIEESYNTDYLDYKFPIQIYLDNGANWSDDSVGTKTIATLSVEGDGVVTPDTILDTVNVSGYYDTGYYKPVVREGAEVTIKATVNVADEILATYKVEGFVIDGEEFIEAKHIGGGVYTAQYTFTKANTVVVPIYFYTDEYVNNKKLQVITLYVQGDPAVTEWGKYMAAYTWYERDNGKDYYGQGVWPGQIMKPVANEENYYEMKVVAAAPDGTPVSGITFSNYGGWSADPKKDNSGVMYPVTNTLNTQVNDYYEFITLANEGSKNITFVLKTSDGNQGNNPPDKDTTAPDVNYFTNYTNYSGAQVDIFNSPIEESEQNVRPSLFIIHKAPITDVSMKPLRGYFYVDCYVYDTNGKYLGTFKSYKLLELDGDNTVITDNNGKSVDFKDYQGERVMIDYMPKTEEGQSNNGSNKAPRYDGQWYKASLTETISVNVALTNDHGENYDPDTDSPCNEAYYGSANVKGLETSVVNRGELTTLSATPAAGYKFIGWYNANGKFLSSSISYEINPITSATYTAVFQELGDGEFIVYHHIYKNGGSADPSVIPQAHKGDAYLYIGIENLATGASKEFTKTEQLSIEAMENEELLITIGTKPRGMDKFFAWYMEVTDKYGKTTFEEVGVDNYHNGEYGNLYDNEMDTVVGSNELVYFQFKYTVPENREPIVLYSDMIPVSADVKLHYKYLDRYGNINDYYHPYVLTFEEIEGCEGNGMREYTPTDETIKKYAPYVEDLYKDTKWHLSVEDGLYYPDTILLWADQNSTIYTVTARVGNKTEYVSGGFGASVELNARDYVSDISTRGMWFEDVGKDNKYDPGEDIVLCYGAYYGLSITKTMNIGYTTTTELEYGIHIEEPIYGREQTKDENGKLTSDFVYVDYMSSILVPLFSGDKTANDQKITDVYYDYNDGNGQVVIPNANNPVTLLTLQKLGYKFDYGMVLEQLNTNVLDKEQVWGKVSLTEDELVKVVDGGIKGLYNNRNITLRSAVNKFDLTNKNRYLYVFQMNNTPANRGKYFHVYGYLKVTDDKGITSYYFSDMRTLNIDEVGKSTGMDQLK